MERGRGARFLAVSCAALAVAHAARADAPSVDVRTWVPSIDPRASLVLEPAAGLEPWTFSASAWLRYESDTVVLRSAGTNAVVSRPLADLGGLDTTLAFALGGRTLVGLRVPFAVESGTGGLPPAVVSDGRVPTASVGDLALAAKGVLVDDRARGFGLAALGEVTFPTGAATSFLSDEGATVTARLLGEWSARAAAIQATLGYDARTTDVRWPGPSGLVFGDAIPWSIGLLVRPSFLHALDPAARQAWELAAHGSIPAGSVAPFSAGSSPLAPAMLALSDRVAFGRHRDGFVLAGVDVGLDRAVGVPGVRATVGVGWTFASHDADRDGIDDDRDACPSLPEDFDGFEDADGCPEADNDEDGIVDAEDACPNVPGAPSTDPRKNGCPAP